MINLTFIVIALWTVEMKNILDRKTVPWRSCYYTAQSIVGHACV